MGSVSAPGVDIHEIDALNERLGNATEDELRGFLLDVQRYCTRDDEPPGRGDATSGTAVG